MSSETSRRHGADGGGRGGPVERFAGVPGAPFVARLELQVAPREVVADGVAEDVVERTGRRDAPPRLADRQYELDLVVQVLGP